MAPAEKDEYRLARDYGLDISMPEVNIAVSSAAQKEYQKKCNFLYKEFQKTMNYYHKEEQMVRNDLNKLNREKVLNNQYSLYRSAGSDLFSKASAKRQHFLKKNIGNVSPLFDDILFNTPWGLDAIVDEDLIRPNTAPVPKSVDEESHDIASPRQISIMPMNDKQPSPSHYHQHAVPAFEYKFMEHPSEKIEHHLTSQLTQNSPPIPPPSALDQQANDSHVDPEIYVPKLEETEYIDGEVDAKTERTRARKLTINARKFNKLQTGDVNVRLKDKDGRFLIKPVQRNYTPEGVDAVFIAKDPSKEVTALVRQNTNWKSPTVAAELKVNNRIAIQKSLMGKNVRKTTVAEIFNSARDRKTRHFRVVLKNANNDENAQKADTDVNDKAAQQPGHSPVIRIYKHQKKMNPSIPGHSKSSQSNNYATVSVQDKKTGKTLINGNITPDKVKGMRIILTPNTRDDPCDRSNTSTSIGNMNRRRDSISSIIRAPSVTGHNDGLNTSGHHRVCFGRMPSNEQVDNSDQPNVQRSISSMSMREGGVQFSFTDKDMTEMLQKVLDGSVACSDDVMDRSASNTSLGGAMKALRMVQNISRLANRKKHAATPDAMSISEKSGSRDLPSRVSSRNALKQIIMDQKKRDAAYEDQMATMRRRVALGAGRRSAMAFR